MFNVPILLTIHSRPEKTKLVFDKIRQIKPNQLFIAADGPRENHETDAVNCAEARKIFNNIDWECSVKTLFRESNLGCREAMHQAISWFFSEIEEGIVLEDDCLPHNDFFYFCEELLGRYRESKEIFVISGSNFINNSRDCEYSYHYSRYMHCWGWASWRRAWKKYDNEMIMWPSMRSEKKLYEILDNNRQVQYWTDIFNQTSSKKIDSWAYVWMYTCWFYNALTIIPKVNLVANIGFGDDATHTKGSSAGLAAASTDLAFPLRHPNTIQINKNADYQTDKNIYTRGVLRHTLRKLKNQFQTYYHFIRKYQ